MKVLLMDLDVSNRRRAFPNLALMKLSAYHKSRGDQVELNFPLIKPDITYASCVFSWNSKWAVGLPRPVKIGGSGVEINSKLSHEIEHIKPDYTLYPDVGFSLGFTSRGCVRKCPWCVVPQKEGLIKPNARIYEFWDRQHKKVLLLDNNLLSASNWEQTMQDILAEGIEVDFNQGLDIRLLNEKKVGYLNKVKAKQLRFSFDSMEYEKAVRRGIEMMIDSGIRSRRLCFYVLVGYGGDVTAVERLKILHNYNVDIFPMVYIGEDGKKPRGVAGSLVQLRDLLELGDLKWHGSRRNINKTLRVIGRLPG